MPLRALILVGGYGTRLRPLTFSVPKPLVPFANTPIVLHQIEALVKAGVKEVILAVNYKPEVMVQRMEQEEKRLGIKIIISKEDEPMGTAGPVALARAHLTKDDSPFFMFNSDVICEFPLQAMLEFHRGHGKEGTIMVTPVEDPSRYGVVVAAADGKISQFVEKPPGPEFPSMNINAGLYLFNPSILNRIEMRPTSIEREIFPQMAGDSQLYAQVLPGYWMDIGQPKDYLRGMVRHLNFMNESKTLPQAPANTTGNVVIDPSATIEAGALVGPDVVIGPNVVVGAGARIRRSTIFSGVHVKPHAVIKSSIIGWDSVVGEWAHLDECIVGEDVTFKAEIIAKGVTVCPHKGVKENVLEPKIIL